MPPRLAPSSHFTIFAVESAFSRDPVLTVGIEEDVFPHVIGGIDIVETINLRVSVKVARACFPTMICDQRLTCVTLVFRLGFTYTFIVAAFVVVARRFVLCMCTASIIIIVMRMAHVTIADVPFSLAATNARVRICTRSAAIDPACTIVFMVGRVKQSVP